MPDTYFPPHHAAIRERSRLTIPQTLISPLSWRADLSAPKAQVAYELMEPGRARIRPLADLTRTWQALAAHPARTSVSIAMFQGAWAQENRITLPDIVAAHVLGDGALVGVMYLWTRDDAIEMWSEARRLFELSEARKALEDYLS